MDEDVGCGIGQMLEGVIDRFLSGFSSGGEFNFAEFFQCGGQQFGRPFFLSGRNGDNNFDNSFDLGEFFKGIAEKRFAVDFDKLFGDFATCAFAFTGGDED